MEEIIIEIINFFVVNEINKIIDFYKEYFDFKIVETDGYPITWCKMKNGNCYIMFEEYRGVCNEMPNFPEKVSSSNLIKFKLSSRNDIENYIKKLKTIIFQFLWN